MAIGKAGIDIDVDKVDVYVEGRPDDARRK